jgi:membrane-bound lytic murein transglycosylase D
LKASVVAIALPPAEQNLWERIRFQITLTGTNNPRIEVEKRWYLNHPEYLRRVSQRSAPYLYYVVAEIERRGLPMELPIMESAYDPFAYSHGRAAGMWQIIPGTGKELGLRQDWWYDGRRDVRASTDAALTYLTRLNKAFDGDWELTLASYNSGKRRVNNAIAANRQKGLGTDFWSLRLPRETRNYVPRLLALAQVIAEAPRHNIALTPVPNQPWFAVVDTGSQIDLAQAAKLAGIGIEQVYLLNSGFSRWATSPNGPHELLLPLQAAPVFEQQLAQLDPDQRVQWKRYTIKSGDSLSTIARRFGSETGVIRDVNGLKDNRIRAGKTLLIPTARAPLDAYTLSSDRRLASKTSRKKGSGQRSEYVVRPGDSFWSIARAHKVSTRKIAEWNGMAVRDPIHPGQTLVMWGSTGSKSAPALRQPTMRKLGYKVRNGDSLARIADKFNISVKEIVGWNGKLQGKKYIHPGQVLTLYVNVTGG